MLKQTPNNRRGVVLLIVLGMLSLFTVLIISFVIFSSQMARTSASNKEQRQTEIPINAPVDTIIRQIVSGTTNPASGIFGNSLLEDMYGIDGVQMRVGHRRGVANRQTFPRRPGIPGGMLMLPNNGNGTPNTTLFKFPTNLVVWDDEGRNIPGLERSPGDSELTTVNVDTFLVQVRPDLDDVFAGRLVTFDEGPLAGVSFRVLRSFSNRMGEPPAARLNQPPPDPAVAPTGATWGPPSDPAYDDLTLYTTDEYSLAGCLVIDLSEMPSEEVEIQDRIQLLYDVADNAPNALLYGPGADGKPGRAFTDDNGDGTVDDPGELGTINSDDYGYHFTLNGMPFNGRGRNPSGVVGLARELIPGTPVVADARADAELQFNTSLIGSKPLAGTNTTPPSDLLEPQADEQWDAADLENLFLAWQPSDHRRVYFENIPPGNRVYVGVGADELNRNLGSQIVPSFHRPSVINYLMNAPIVLPGEDPTQAGYQPRTFAMIRNTPVFTAPQRDHLRLRALVERVRRATLRPLNVSHLAFTSAASDLNGDGFPFDGAPGFSGSNPAPIMSQAIDLSRDYQTTNGFQNIAADLYNLALWLVNGPWDVDNDGDGLPDSVWIDPGLANTVAPDGTLIRPLSAILIEDMDGKINLNYHGSFAQLLEQTLLDGPRSGSNDRRYFNEAEFFGTARALDSFGFGGGVGPAEVDFSHLFADFGANQTISPYPNNFNGPITVNQLGPQLGLVNNFAPQPISGTIGLLRSRYGNLINVRQGGQVYDYVGNQPTDYPQGDQTKFPAVGDFSNPAVGTSLLSRIPFPARPEIPVQGSVVSPPTASTNYSSASVIGRPVDMNGVMRTRKGAYGGHEFSRPAVVGEVFNQPYETGATEALGDDQPFTAAEYIDFLENGPMGGRLAQLLSDAAQRNKALQHLLAIEGRSVDSPEIPGVAGFVELLASKLANLTDPPNPPNPARSLALQQSHLDRMLAIELRKGSKLNLNRPISNGSESNNNAFVDETDETETALFPSTTSTPNEPQNRASRESAFPQIVGNYPATAPNPPFYNANYSPETYPQANFGGRDFDGIDTNGDGNLDSGTQFDLDGDGNVDTRLKMASGGELLARHLYVLMFTLVHDPDAAGVLVKNFPYPAMLTNTPSARNRYAAKRIAQWAVNAVDYRDTNVARTRLRYDPNPFDGFDPVVASRNTIWGMERPELELTEAIAFHDKRLRRNLNELTYPHPESQNAGQSPVDEDSGVMDEDMDQFRIPQASAFVELHSLRSPVNGNVVAPPNVRDGSFQPSLPRELYTNNELDLGRIVGGTVTVGGNTIDLRSPVWRIAVGEPTGNDFRKSTRWLFDAERLSELVKNPPHGRPAQPDELSYLNNGGADMGTVADVDTELADWKASIRHSAEIGHVAANPPTQRVEAVRLADDDFDPSNGSNHDVQLERFAWFANLPPDDGDPTTPPTLNVVTSAGSGMRPENVYYNRGVIQLPGVAAAVPTPTRLRPGGYAVLGPRASTSFGQTSASSSGAWEYHPVEQRFEFKRLAAPLNGLFKLNYHNLTSTNPMTPRYQDHSSGNYHVRDIVPLICESLRPHQLDGSLTGWSNYYGSVPAEEAVDMGFNISAPLPGNLYYPVPQYRISGNGPPTHDSPAGGYPLVDGYGDPLTGDLTFPDVPFDHDRGPTNATPRPIPSVMPTPMGATYHTMNSDLTVNPPIFPPPMESITSQPASGILLKWNAIGTHQEACTIFLQRLADPTRPWHAIDNPYLTEDFIPIDLTTFNGEGDAKELIDHDDDENAVPPPPMPSPREIADYSRSQVNGTEFVPAVKLDSRRKIPDVRKDRVATKLVRDPSAPPATSPSNLQDYERQEMVKRSALSATFSILRVSNENNATAAYWEYEVGSSWVNQNLTESTDFHQTTHNPTLTFDDITLGVRHFTQTLGFVNREYGFPIRSDEQRIGPYEIGSPLLANGLVDGQFYVGAPRGVELASVTWMDREYQSPLDIMNVPAVSRTGLLPTFTTGTSYIDPPGTPATTKTNEVPDNFGHLLGFDRGFDFERPEDTAAPRLPLGYSQNAVGRTYDADRTLFTGERAGFEQIFDYVDTGPVWFDSQRWIDPAKVAIKNDTVLNNLSLSADYRNRARLFNRVVTTLQPPYNYIGKHRTPGKINLNTTPDYVRKGPGFTPNTPGFLDEQEFSETPAGPRMPRPQTAFPPNLPLISINPQNSNTDENDLTVEFRDGSRLFANGSVHRSLTWNMSTPYELDSYVDSSGPVPLQRVMYGSPSILGETNGYEEVVDTPFGRSFKAFIESRRGYPDTTPGATYLGNPELDWRYPTRFAGVFGTARSSSLGSVQRFMRADDETGIGVVRRTHDMGLLRPHPDFDRRLISSTDRANHDNVVSAPNPWPFSLGIEVDGTASGANDGAQTGANPGVEAPSPIYGGPEMPPGTPPSSGPAVTGLRMSMLRTRLFERPQAELHSNYRGLDRDSYFRYSDTARLANLTTGHSNVFLIRMTTSYFVVDPTTGALGDEYVNSAGEPVRTKSTFIVDRTIPVGFLPGKQLNTLDTVIYSEVQQ